MFTESGQEERWIMRCAPCFGAVGAWLLLLGLGPACSFGSVCADECCAAADCADSQTCRDGQCVDEPPACEHECCAHTDCAASQRCIDGQCLDEPPACGDAAPDCEWTRVEADCRGAWVCSHLDTQYCWCDCPTGDAGCPCWDASHCQGDCIAEQEDPHDGQCAWLGQCSARTTNLGCICVAEYDRSGLIEVCRD